MGSIRLAVGLALAGVLAAQQVAAFGGENPAMLAGFPIPASGSDWHRSADWPTYRANWHHPAMSFDAATEAGFTEPAAASVAWSSDYIDSYIYNPLWWAGRPGTQRLMLVLATRGELGKLHFDDLFSPQQVRAAWDRLLGGTFAGLVWASERDDVTAAHHIVGVSLHALQDFYTHSNWLQDPGRRDLLWGDVHRAERGTLSLWTGWYEFAPQQGRKPHGKYGLACTAMSQLPIQSLLLPACMFTPLGDAGTCAIWRVCGEADSFNPPTLKDSIYEVDLPEGVVYLEPAGINLDNTWLADIGRQTRELEDVSAAEIFATAKELAEGGSVAWLQSLGTNLARIPGGEAFWGRVKSEGTLESKETLAPQLARHEKPYEEYHQLPYTFVSAGPYPPRTDVAQGGKPQTRAARRPASRPSRQSRQSRLRPPSQAVRAKPTPAPSKPARVPRPTASPSTVGSKKRIERPSVTDMKTDIPERVKKAPADPADRITRPGNRLELPGPLEMSTPAASLPYVDGTYLRVRLDTGAMLGAGTDADLVLEAKTASGGNPCRDLETCRFTLDYAPPAESTSLSPIQKELLQYNDFEPGFKSVYIVGPFSELPATIKILNLAPSAAEIAVQAQTDLAATIEDGIEQMKDTLVGLIAGHADLVGTGRLEWGPGKLDFPGVDEEESFMVRVDGELEGDYKVYGRIKNIGAEDEGTGFRITWDKLECVEEAFTDQLPDPRDPNLLNKSDEPFVFNMVVPLGGEAETKRRGPFNGVDSGDERTIDRSRDVVVPPYGSLSVVSQVWESDSEDSGDRTELYEEFKAEVERARDEAHYDSITMLAEAAAAEWQLAGIEVYAFQRSPQVVTGEVLPRSEGGWILGGESRSFALDAERLTHWPVWVEDLELPAVASEATARPYRVLNVERAR